ncbi:TPR-like protein, partial [Rhizoctonia solani]
SSILTVGQESTPGLGDLPETVLELAKIRQYLPLHTHTELTGLDATKNTVLDMMQTHDWVHFACHAHQDINDPTESGFFLSDGTLSIASITERSLKNKGLAFLSACQTATGDKTLTDESVHLASAMLAAGYSGVVATMWSIQDSDGPLVAGKFYEKVINGGRMDHTEAAKALHVAVGIFEPRLGKPSSSVGFRSFISGLIKVRVCVVYLQCSIDRSSDLGKPRLAGGRIWDAGSDKMFGMFSAFLKY